MWREVRTRISQPYRPCSLCTRKPFLSNIRSYMRLFRVWQKNFTTLGKVAQEPQWKKQKLMVSAIDNLNIPEKMSTFEAANTNNPMFKVMCHYTYMVMEMVAFIRAVRIRDWSLHLIAVEMFTKYFFAHDRINHAFMIAVYLAEMSSLSEGDPEIHKELILGNWLVNKNAQVPFCARADNALKHEDCSMKVSGGLAGITLNKTALTKFFSDSSRARKASWTSKEKGGGGGWGVFQDWMSSSQPH